MALSLAFALLQTLLAVTAPAPASPPPPPDDPPAGAASSAARPAFVAAVSRRFEAYDVPGLTALCARAAGAEEDLLCRYRLFPLDHDERHLRALPDAEAVPSARGLALLSALWAYRAGADPVWKLPSNGMRSEALLDRARERDAREPYVLLIEALGLLYKPAVFGGSPEAALVRFDRLRGVAAANPEAGISPVEAEVWKWYTLRKLGRPHTERIRERLLAERPPPVFHQFLIDPP